MTYVHISSSVRESNQWMVEKSRTSSSNCILFLILFIPSSVHNMQHSFGLEKKKYLRTRISGSGDRTPAETGEGATRVGQLMWDSFGWPRKENQIWGIFLFGDSDDDGFVLWNYSQALLQHQTLGKAHFALCSRECKESRKVLNVTLSCGLFVEFVD